MKTTPQIVAIGGLVLSALSPLSAQTAFRIDRPHTMATFTVGYTGGITNVEGRFNDFSGTLTFDPSDITRGTASLVFNVASIDTGHERRDRDLSSATWFNVDEYPQMTFEGEVSQRGDSLFLIGDLTVKDVVARLEIPFERTHEPEVVWASGRPHVGFRGSVTIDRRDFRLPEGGSGGVVTSIGRLFVSPEVEIRLSVQAVGPGLDDLLFETVMEEGVAEAISTYQEMKRIHGGADTYSFHAGSLTFLLPRLLEADHVEAAAALAELNLSENPDSHFSYYGLALARRGAGDIVGAIESLRRALEIRPGHRLSTILLRELE